MISEAKNVKPAGQTIRSFLEHLGEHLAENLALSVEGELLT